MSIHSLYIHMSVSAKQKITIISSINFNVLSCMCPQQYQFVFPRMLKYNVADTFYSIKNIYKNEMQIVIQITSSGIIHSFYCKSLSVIVFQRLSLKE